MPENQALYIHFIPWFLLSPNPCNSPHNLCILYQHESLSFHSSILNRNSSMIQTLWQCPDYLVLNTCILYICDTRTPCLSAPAVPVPTMHTPHQGKNHVASETYSGLSRLSRLERNLWDIVVTVHCVMLTDAGHSHGCSSTFQTQFSLTDANSSYRCRSHSYWCQGSSYSYNSY